MAAMASPEFDVQAVARESSVLCRENAKLRAKLKELEASHTGQVSAFKDALQKAETHTCDNCNKKDGKLSELQSQVAQLVQDAELSNQTIDSLQNHIKTLDSQSSEARSQAESEARKALEEEKAQAQRQRQKLETQHRQQADELAEVRKKLAQYEDACRSMAPASELQRLRAQLQGVEASHKAELASERAKTEAAETARSAAEKAARRNAATHTERIDKLQRELCEARELLAKHLCSSQRQQKQLQEEASAKEEAERLRVEAERLRRAAEAAAAERRREGGALKEAQSEARQALAAAKKAEAAAETERQRIAAELRKTQATRREWQSGETADLVRMRKDSCAERERSEALRKNVELLSIGLAELQQQMQQLQAKADGDQREKDELRAEIKRLREQLQSRPEVSVRSPFSSYVALRREAIAATREQKSAGGEAFETSQRPSRPPSASVPASPRDAPNEYYSARSSDLASARIRVASSGGSAQLTPLQGAQKIMMGLSDATRAPPIKPR